MPHDLERSVETRSASRFAATAFFWLFVVIQTGVPLILLSKPRPARFGWQMYSAVPKRASFDLVMRDGASRPVDLRLYVAQSRGDADLQTALPPHLCHVVPDVAAVRITAPGAKEARVFRCPR
jgi:hypothetical protein